MNDDIPTLVCPCGNVMKAPGARPGRVGKCPKCGAKVVVQAGSEAAPKPEPRPEPERRKAPPIVPTAGGYGVAAEPERSSTFEAVPKKSGGVGFDARSVRPPDLGPVKAPLKAETSIAGSFGYPLWSWSSVGLLLFLPPILSVTTSPLPFLAQALFSNSAFVVPAYVSLIPGMLFMTCSVGYVLIYLGDILVASASGDPIPPRVPRIDEEFRRLLLPWTTALLSGAIVGGVPCYFYWLNCGEIDWIDRLMFFNLTMLGLAYAQLALLSTLLHDDPLAANPFTVAQAAARLGWNYVGVTAFSLAIFALLAGGLALVSMVKDSIVHLLLYWLYWVVALHLEMVVFRRLGLYCRSRKLIETWFTVGPRGGAPRTML